MAFTFSFICDFTFNKIQIKEPNVLAKGNLPGLVLRRGEPLRRKRENHCARPLSARTHAALAERARDARAARTSQTRRRPFHTYAFWAATYCSSRRLQTTGAHNSSLAHLTGNDNGRTAPTISYRSGIKSRARTHTPRAIENKNNYTRRIALLPSRSVALRAKSALVARAAVHPQ